MLDGLTTTKKEMELLAAEIRQDVMRMIIGKGKGHPGGALSMVDILTALYFSVMNVNPQNPNDPDRDRFLLSKGHACTGLYATLAKRGYFPHSTLETYYSLNSFLGGHPVKGLPGIEVATGSLGHGPSIGIGMALSAKMNKKTHRVFVLVGDGEIQEGVIWEAALFSAHHQLDNFILIIDRNRLQSDDATEELLAVEPIIKKFDAFGWECKEVDGHDVEALSKALQIVPFKAGKPSLLIADTIKGRGVDFMENVAYYHNKGPLPGTEDAEKALSQLEERRNELAQGADYDK